MVERSASKTNRRFFFGTDRQEDQLLLPLRHCLEEADSIAFAVSFIKESGALLLIEDLKKAAARNARIRILCGSYLHITEPSALAVLKNELKDQADIHFYTENNRSFHPKCYLFEIKGQKKAFIGSSNLSRSALTRGIEWNALLEGEGDQSVLEEIETEFNVLFAESRPLNDELLKWYSTNWVRPAAAVTPSLEKAETVVEEIQPRGAQIEALYALQNTRANNYRKALIQAATGTGKTYLAAFDSRPFKRVLFVAHRQEILEQAASSFRKVRPYDSIGFYNASEKNLHADLVFASIFSLSGAVLQPGVLKPDAFDYVVIDEFHHAAAASYTTLLAYLKPKFLLGLTATPERMDGRSVYALCDYNVPYTIDLKSAINRGLLVPFRYYGIYDKTDYSAMRRSNSRFVVQDLEDAYTKDDERTRLILRHYQKYRSRAAMGFCASRVHALYMARSFSRQGIKAAAVYSDSGHVAGSMDRHEALEALRNGSLQVIFCVDMFNEGVDVDFLDLVMFLRPTESTTIFLQQLGRGLRLAPNKSHLTVLDFIGNYDKALMAPTLLSGVAANGLNRMALSSLPMPAGCLYDFDLDLIDLFEKMSESRQKMPRSRNYLQERLQKSYEEIRHLLGHRPTQKELFDNLDEDLLQGVLKNTDLNPFTRYLYFLRSMNDLSPEEEQMLKSPAGQFLNRLETTNMQRVYKMPVLMAFLDNGHIRKEISEEQVLKSWKTFFSQNENWKDLSGKGKMLTFKEFEAITDSAHLSKIKRMPVTYLLKSDGIFLKSKDGALLALAASLDEWCDNPVFYQAIRQILEFRTHYYYWKRYEEKTCS